MSCPTPADLARDAAVGDDPVVAEHLRTCLMCRRERDEQRTVRAQLAAMRRPVLSDARRDALAAAVMARTDAAAMRATDRVAWRRRHAWIAVAAAAAAAATCIVLAWPRDAARRAAPVADDRRDEGAPGLPPPADRPPPATDVDEARDSIGGTARATVAPPAAERRRGDAREPARPPVRPSRARVQRGGRAVFAGAGDAEPAPEIARYDHELAPPDDAAIAFAAFRTGWEALRRGRHDDAIAAFDRATDPAIAEEAMFWAAIAAQRTGRTDDARRRFGEFLRRFPRSPRAASAARALESAD